MKIETLAVGALQVNCYIVYDDSSKMAMIIDPGDEPDRILDRVKEKGLTVEYLVITHAHFDHVGAIPELKEATGAKIVLHESETGMYQSVKEQGILWGFKLDDLPKPDMLVKEGDEIKTGGLAFKVLYTPGHSPGGMCLFGEGTLFSGDTLFKDSVGRTDLHGGDMNKLKSSFKRLMSLPAETKVYPGHMESSSIEYENRENFFRYEIK